VGMQCALAMADEVAATDATVLLRGESGTGKGVLARAMHERSQRASRRFGVVNCPSLSEELLASELFGHVRGAFTGAVQNNTGTIAFTEGGTLFLDEIGDLPLSIQPKLLRFLQDREYERLGDPRTRRADVRILVATNQPLERGLQQGTFREDLYYRLSVFPIEIPPLRERREDIPNLAHRFLETFAVRYRKSISDFTEDAMRRLIDHPWPGNVRELQNTIERAVILTRSHRIDPGVLPGLRSRSGVPEFAATNGDMLTLEQMEKRYIRHVLDSVDTVERAAEVLDLSPSTLWRRRRKHGI